MPATPSFRIDIRRNNSRWPTARAQRWTWTVTNTGNNRVMGRSSETYTNESDCADAAVALFGDGARVRLQRADGSSVIVREMVT